MKNDYNDDNKEQQEKPQIRRLTLGQSSRESQESLSTPDLSDSANETIVPKPQVRRIPGLHQADPIVRPISSSQQETHNSLHRSEPRTPQRPDHQSVGSNEPQQQEENCNPDRLAMKPKLEKGQNPLKQNHKHTKKNAKNSSRPLLITLDLLIVFCLLGAAYFYIAPKIKSKRRSQIEASAVAKIDRELTQASDLSKSITITVDPKANKVSGESYEDFGGEFKENYVYDKNGNVVVNFIGALKIPKINLNTPIADDDNLVALRYGVGHTPESSPVGQDGRCIIFGHWFLDYGKVFNRLEEVKEGDKFHIDMLANRTRYFYEVYKVASISDKDLYDRLFSDPVGVKSEIVLVTCIVRNNDWRNPSGRYLVYGKLVDTEVVSANEQVH